MQELMRQDEGNAGHFVIPPSGGVMHWHLCPVRFRGLAAFEHGSGEGPFEITLHFIALPCLALAYITLFCIMDLLAFFF